MRIFILIFFLCLLFDVFSQNIATDTVKIGEIKVTTSKIKDQDKSIVPMQSISIADLERLSGNTLADAVRNFSGVIIKDYGGIGGLKTVMVRSLGANHTGVFIDGVQFSDAASGQVDLGKISTDNCSDVSLFIGQTNNKLQSARFYASANVLNICSLEPDFSLGRTNIKTLLRTGSFGLIQPSLVLQQQFRQSCYLDFSVNYTKAHGEYTFWVNNLGKDSIAKRMNSDIEALNLNLYLNLNFKNRSKLSSRLYYYDSERGLPGAVVFYNPFAVQRLWNNDFFADLQYKTSENTKLKAISIVKYSQNWLRYLDPEYLNSEGKLDNRYLQREIYVSQVFNYIFAKRLSFSFANDLIFNTLNANLYQYATPTRYTYLSAFDVNYKIGGFEIDANLIGTVVRETTQIGRAAPNRNKLNPTFIIAYRLNKRNNLLVRFLYKDIFRMPTFNDLYYTMVGNNELLPENAKQFNLGFSGYWQNRYFSYFSLKSEFYYNKVTDKIVAVPTKNLFIWSMRNIGIVDIKGFELVMHIETPLILRIFRYNIIANYSFQSAKDITDSASPTFKQQIPYIPFETFSINQSIEIKNFTFNHTLLFNGFRYFLGENIYENVLPSWTINNLVLFYDFSLSKKVEMKIKLEINNVFDIQYEVIKSFPMPGRHCFVGLTLKF